MTVFFTILKKMSAICLHFLRNVSCLFTIWSPSWTWATCRILATVLMSENWTLNHLLKCSITCMITVSLKSPKCQNLDLKMSRISPWVSYLKIILFYFHENRNRLWDALLDSNYIESSSIVGIVQNPTRPGLVFRNSWIWPCLQKNTVAWASFATSWRKLHGQKQHIRYVFRVSRLATCIHKIS